MSPHQVHLDLPKTCLKKTSSDVVTTSKSDVDFVRTQDLPTTSPRRRMPNGLWADDILMLSETEEGLQLKLNKLEEYCKANKLCQHRKNKMHGFQQKSVLIILIVCVDIIVETG